MTVEYTEREKYIIEIFKKVLDSKDEEISHLRTLLALNRNGYKFESISTIDKGGEVIKVTSIH